MNHLDEVPGAGWPGVNIAALGAVIALLAARRMSNFARSRGERREDRIEVIDGFLGAADHQAIAALETPDAARRSAIDVPDLLRGQFFGAPDIVFIEGVAAVDDDVARFEEAAKLGDCLFGDFPCGQHHPDRSRLLFELFYQICQRMSGCGAFLCKCQRWLWDWRRTPHNCAPLSSSGGKYCRPCGQVRSRRSACASLRWLECTRP